MTKHVSEPQLEQEKDPQDNRSPSHLTRCEVYTDQAYLKALLDAEPDDEYRTRMENDGWL